MQDVHKPIARRSTTNRSAVTNGTKLLVGIDMRSPTARRYRDLVQAYKAEIGEELTEAEKCLVKQAAALTLQAELMQADIVNGKPVDSDVLIRISGTAKRLIAEIAGKAGNRKPPAAPSLAEYWANRHDEEEG